MTLAVILPAAGIGERLGSHVPKQFILINGLPLICHTISSFIKTERVDIIIIVCSDNYYDFVSKKVVSKFPDDVQRKLKIAIGAETRHRSIANGLDYFRDKETPEIVIIHDAVRPIVKQPLLDSLIAAANDYGASGPVCKLTSTVLKAADDDVMDSALQRNLYWNSEMPQVFRYEAIRTAYDNCSEWNFTHGTECLDLIKQYTHCSVKLIRGMASELFKVTYKRDIYAVEGLLRESQKVAISSTVADSALITEIKASLKDKFNDVTIGAKSSFVDILISVMDFDCLSDLQSKFNESPICGYTKTLVILISKTKDVVSVDVKLRDLAQSLSNGPFVILFSTSEKQKSLIRLTTHLAWNFTEDLFGQIVQI